MPLPRSLTCNSCQHTYPDGWKRCPYCGFDPEKQKRDRQIERALVKRFPRYAAAVSKGGGEPKRKPQSRRERTQDRPPQQGDQVRDAAAQSDASEGERKRSRRRRGRRRRAPGSESTTPQDGVGAVQPRTPRRQDSDERARAAAPPTPPREPRAQQQGQSEAGGGAESQARRTRRRRPRRRRKPGSGGGDAGGEQKSDS